MGEHTDRVYVLTGADSGIGARTADLLRDRGARVITCGISGRSDVRADIAEPAGRAALRAAVHERAPAGIDGLALVAGIGAPSPATVRVNYFGTLAVLEGLRELLLRSSAPRAVAVSSASALSHGDSALVRACLRGDEQRATARAARLARWGRGGTVYRSTKIALNRWVRRHASGPSWAGSGVPLNVVAPGVVDTASARASILGDPVRTAVVAEALPQPLGFPGPVEAVAEAIAWALTPANAFTVGQIVHVDGGADAALRGDGPYRDGVRYGPAALVRMARAAVAARTGRVTVTPTATPTASR